MNINHFIPKLKEVEVIELFKEDPGVEVLGRKVSKIILICLGIKSIALAIAFSAFCLFVVIFLWRII